MSAQVVSQVREIAKRLGELSDRLGDPELPDADAEALAKEAAELAARGGGLIEESLRSLASRPAPEQGEEVGGTPSAEPPPNG
jgi:hypothetical protein